MCSARASVKPFKTPPAAAVRIGGDRRRRNPIRVRRPSDAPVAFKTVAPDGEDMVDILAENLSGKAVMSSDGTELGDLYNITMDLKSGELNDLLVSPHEQLSPDRLGFDVDETGRLKVPVANVQAVKDYIVVAR